MPTDLPVRRRVQNREDRAESAQPLPIFYATVGLAVLTLIYVENQVGIFDGVTNSEAAMEATNIPILPDGIQTNWNYPPP